MAIATLTPPPSMSSSLDKIPVWLDCDVGHDDAMAIILAAYHPNINLLGISSVAGYSTIKHTTDNAIRVLKIAGIKGVKVHKGAHKPLIKKRVDSSIFHGRTGMARVSNLPDPNYESYFVEDVTAIEAMRKAIMKSPVSVSIVATGPLTNIALLVSVYREVIPRIKTLSIMGGAIGFGDFTPAAEFNFFCDPDAAQMVFQSGIENIVLIPLEVTNTVLSTKTVLKRIQDEITVPKFSTFATEVLRVFGDTFSYIHDDKDGYPLQDPVA
ncbi:Uridine nucleosidase 1, partial [Coemansia sp. RSA 2603]